MSAVRDYPLEDRTIGRILADKARTVGDRPFLLFDGRRRTYADAHALTNSYAEGFRRAGIGRGDHVALMLDNRPELLWAIWGLGKLGAVAVPLNTAAKGDLLVYLLDQSDSVLLCAEESYRERVDGAVAKVPGVRGVLGPDRLAGFACLQAADPPEMAEIRHSDPHLIMYTSGTTGPSKGVVCPHSQGHAVGRQMAALSGYGPDDVLYTCLPVFHANALWFTIYAALWADASVALVPRLLRPPLLGRDPCVRRDGVQRARRDGQHHLAAAGVAARPRPPRARRDDGAQLPRPRRTLRPALRHRHHLGLRDDGELCGHGLRAAGPGREGVVGRVGCATTWRSRSSTTTSVAAAGRRDRRDLHPTAVSRAASCSATTRCPPRRSRQPPTCGSTPATAAASTPDGYLYFADRKKEAIRRRGENISAYEVETVLCNHPAVVEAAAVPVPSELGEDEVMAYVVPAPDADVGLRRARAFCAEHMAYYMVPRYLEVIDELPKTPSEKIEKYKLTVSARERLNALWDREKAGIAVRRS